MSWAQLQAILDSRATSRQAEDHPPSACPLCGEPLTEGPKGLFCKYDGWAYRQ